MLYLFIPENPDWRPHCISYFLQGFLPHKTQLPVDQLKSVDKSRLFVLGEHWIQKDETIEPKR